MQVIPLDTVQEEFPLDVARSLDEEEEKSEEPLFDDNTSHEDTASQVDSDGKISKVDTVASNSESLTEFSLPPTSGHTQDTQTNTDTKQSDDDEWLNWS